MLQVLVDADNVAPPRLQPLLDLLAELPEVHITASGRSQALAAIDWPDGTTQLADAGWQRADVALAEAYSPDGEPLVLVSGDGDFALLAARHSGAVLVISGAASARLRDHAMVVDPAIEGLEPVRQWLRANGVSDEADWR